MCPRCDLTHFLLSPTRLHDSIALPATLHLPVPNTPPSLPPTHPPPPLSLPSHFCWQRGAEAGHEILAPNSPPLHCSNAINSTGGNRRGDLEKFLINPIKLVHGLRVCVCGCMCLQMKMLMVDDISGQKSAGQTSLPHKIWTFFIEQAGFISLGGN